MFRKYVIPFCSEDGSNRFLRNSGAYLQTYIAHIRYVTNYIWRCNCSFKEKRRSGVRFTAEARYLSVLQNVPTGYRAYAASYSVSTEAVSQGMKLPWHEVDHWPPSITAGKQIIDVRPLLPHTPSWRRQGIDFFAGILSIKTLIGIILVCYIEQRGRKEDFRYLISGA